jgi:hypothetical protein
MDPLLQANPEECLSLIRKLEAKGERYQGFCKGGDADGRGVLDGEDGRYGWSHSTYSAIIQKGYETL